MSKTAAPENKPRRIAGNPHDLILRCRMGGGSRPPPGDRGTSQRKAIKVPPDRLRGDHHGRTTPVPRLPCQSRGSTADAPTRADPRSSRSPQRRRTALGFGGVATGRPRGASRRPIEGCAARTAGGPRVSSGRAVRRRTAPAGLINVPSPVKATCWSGGRHPASPTRRERCSPEPRAAASSRPSPHAPCVVTVTRPTGPRREPVPVHPPSHDRAHRPHGA